MKQNKLEALRQNNVLNPKPEKVKDDLFLESSFFDSNDIVQVKYEMVRRHLQEGKPITQVVKAFGFSRVTFYETKEALKNNGIAGLIPKQRGPKMGHKLTPPMVEFALEQMKQDPKLTIETILKLIT